MENRQTNRSCARNPQRRTMSPTGVRAILCHPRAHSFMYYVLCRIGRFWGGFGELLGDCWEILFGELFGDCWEISSRPLPPSDPPPKINVNTEMAQDGKMVSMYGARWAHFGPAMAPRRPKTAPWTVQDGPMDGPRTRRKGS